MLKAVLFDMDGTLLDTLTDLSDTMKYLMRHYGVNREFTVEEYKHMVGQGAAYMMETALAGVDLEKEAGNIFSLFDGYYRAHMLEHASVYEGVADLLQSLKQDGYQLGVISNSPDYYVQGLISHFFEPDTFATVVGQREGVPSKPDAAQVRIAMEALGVEARECVYVGDSETDLMTAKNAGMPCISVSWGFQRAQALEKAGAVYIAEHPEKIPAFFPKVLT